MNEEMKLTEKVSVKEIAAYGCFNAGNSVYSYLLNSFGNYFYTNVVGIDALLTGSFMTAVKIIDFITDILLGSLIDGTKNKSGEKIKPWLKRSLIPCSVGIVLLFSAPFAEGAAKIIWAIATYFLATSICFTMSTIPFQSFVSVATSDRFSRSKMEITGAVVAMAVSMGSGFVIEPLTAALGGGRRGWFIAAVILAVVVFIVHLIGFLGLQERVHVEKPAMEKLSFGQTMTQVGYLLKNRYWVLMALFTAVTSLSTMMASMMYYVQYIVRDFAVFGYMTVLNMAPTILMLFAAPFIIKKFGKVMVIRVGMACMIIGFGIMWFVGGTSIYIGLPIAAFGMGGGSATMFSFVADAIDYGEYKFGVRNEGLAFSLFTSVQKLAQAAASLVLGILLTWGAFNAAEMVQTEKALLAIKIAFLGVPLIIAVLNLIISFFLNVEKKYPNMAEDLQKLRAERAAK